MTSTLFENSGSENELIGDGVLVRDVDLVSAVWAGRFEVALNDRYHFDHPLDHVPGMALVSGLLELVRHSGAADLRGTGRRMSLSVTFPAFCELDEQVHLQAVQFPAGGSSTDVTLSLLAEQEEHVVCEADLSLRRDPGTVPRASALSSVRRLPADPATVNRRRAENVLITGMTAHGDARVVGLRPVTRTHPLAAGPGQPHMPELIVDAARQFCTMVNHLEHGRSDNTRFVMLRIDANLPCGLRGETYLRWSVTPPARGRSAFTADLLMGDPASEPCGSVSFEYYAATPAVYRRLRGEARS